MTKSRLQQPFSIRLVPNHTQYTYTCVYTMPSYSFPAPSLHSSESLHNSQYPIVIQNVDWVHSLKNIIASILENFSKIDIRPAEGREDTLIVIENNKRVENFQTAFNGRNFLVSVSRNSGMAGKWEEERFYIILKTKYVFTRDM